MNIHVRVAPGPQKYRSVNWASNDKHSGDNREHIDSRAILAFVPWQGLVLYPQRSRKLLLSMGGYNNEKNRVFLIGLTGQTA